MKKLVQIKKNTTRNQLDKSEIGQQSEKIKTVGKTHDLNNKLWEEKKMKQEKVILNYNNIILN
jgi:hypothetical protein